MVLRSLLKIFIIILLSSNLFAEELIEYTDKEVISHAHNPVRARQRVLRIFSEKVSSDMIKRILGQKKYRQNLALIKTKILNQTEKFIPFSRIIKLEELEKGKFKASVMLKLSSESLKDLLFKEGFMSNMERGVVLLPLFSIADRIEHKSYNWWKEPVNRKEDGFLIQQKIFLLKEMRREFSKKGLYVLDPVKWGYYYNVPKLYRSDSMRTKDVQFLSHLYGSQMAIRGEVDFRPGSMSQTAKIFIRWTIVHTDNGRVIAESVGRYETEPGNRQNGIRKVLTTQGKDLVVNLVQQVMEAWKKGRLSVTQIVQVDINGAMEYADIQSFRSNLKNLIPEMKSIKERFFQSDRVVFEVDILGGVQELVEHLRSMEGFKVASVRDDRVVLSVGK